jgi:hypothetical protein
MSQLAIMCQLDEKQGLIILFPEGGNQFREGFLVLPGSDQLVDPSLGLIHHTDGFHEDHPCSTPESFFIPFEGQIRWIPFMVCIIAFHGIQGNPID